MSDETPAKKKFKQMSTLDTMLNAGNIILLWS